LCPYVIDMMTKDELQQYLSRLDLTAVEAAQLLGVTPRTVRRWLDGEDVAGPAEQAVRAWIRLHERHLPWRPDGTSVSVNDEEQIALHRRHAIDLADLMARVEARGGPRLSGWKVDRDRGRAVFGPIEVSFYKLLNGGFSLANYTRKDGDPDVQRDAEIIEDAAYCIAQSLKKEPDFGPVTLVVHDGPAKGRVAKQQLEKFPSNKAAIQRVCETLGSPGFHEPFIMTESPGEVLWDTHDLWRECERRTKAPAALAALANYVRTKSAFFVRSGPQMLTPAATTQRRQRIEALADKLDGLAGKAREGLADYQQFEGVLGELHAAGFFPEGELVSAVAAALVRE
jgi:hypothetical protein